MRNTRSQSKSRSAQRHRESLAPGPTREKLLDVAGHVFADRGYQAATIREICVRAGANVAAVNYHFGDKLGLYTEVLQLSVRAAQIEAIRNALDKTAPPEEILRAVIRARLRGLWRGDLPDWHFKILSHELVQPSPAFRPLINKVARPLLKRLLELIGGMIDLPPDDDKTRLCAISVMGQILAYVFAGPLLVGVWPGLKMTREQVERIADHIADFSLSYLQQFRSYPESIAPVRAQRVRK
jgi:AcrR family transcriptional regulator